MWSNWAELSSESHCIFQIKCELFVYISFDGVQLTIWQIHFYNWNVYMLSFENMWTIYFCVRSPFHHAVISSLHFFCHLLWNSSIQHTVAFWERNKKIELAYQKFKFTIAATHKCWTYWQIVNTYSGVERNQPPTSHTNTCIRVKLLTITVEIENEISHCYLHVYLWGDIPFLPPFIFRFLCKCRLFHTYSKCY